MRMDIPGDVKVPEDLQETARFHGHLCPGLALGYRAVRAAMDRMGLERSRDEELVCVVENDSCSVDAVQYLAGCTFGKGNLVFRDHGKQVFTFASRSHPGKAVRVSLRADAFPPPGDEEPSARRERVLRKLLEAPLKELFRVEEVDFRLPEEAVIHPSVPCERCGEPTMQTRLVEVDGKKLCIPCAEAVRVP
ncbi:MAG: FmdE family protein [Actinomycetota bacterium]|nr:FmdE family protein [Actinomycetota bacterium]MDI7252934.1 FmdE family protein [Actinomycetota bacterium]